MQLDLYSHAGRRQDFQPEFIRHLHPARDVLRLLRVFADRQKGADFASFGRLRPKGFILSKFR
jgi:hypothetical protein